MAVRMALFPGWIYIDLGGRFVPHSSGLGGPRMLEPGAFGIYFLVTKDI